VARGCSQRRGVLPHHRAPGHVEASCVIDELVCLDPCLHLGACSPQFVLREAGASDLWRSSPACTTPPCALRK
jgi:hypothetical protein